MCFRFPTSCTKYRKRSIMAESEDAKREKWRNMNREDGDMKLDANRRAGSVGSKRGAEIYRPGCGLYPPRSPRGELEDNMSNSNSNLHTASMSSEKRQADSDGTQNGPSHSQSRGGNGRRSGHSGRSRSGRGEKLDGRNNRDNKDAVVSKLSERLSVVTLERDESQQSHGNDSIQPEGSNTVKAVQNNDSIKRTKKPEQQIYIPKPIAQSMANKEAASKLSNNHRDGTDCTDDDSTSYCAEDDSRAGNSQGGKDGPKKKSKRKKKGRRGENSERSEGGHSNGKPAPDSSSRGGNGQSGGRNELSGRQNNSSGSRQDAPRSNQASRTDNPSRSGARSGTDSKPEPSRSSSKSESVNTRLSQWTNHDNRSDSSNRGGSVSNAMTRSMIDQRRNNEEVHKFDEASMTQSWHADVPSARNVRLGSEPRGAAPGSVNMDNSRSRDSRSVEPSSWNADKVQAKPPSGRRGSGKDISYCSGSNSKSQSRLKEADVPPRFRKKQPENGTREPPAFTRENPSTQASMDKGRYIGTTSEETWDGSTVTFQGSHGPQSSQNNYSGQYHSLPSMSLPPTPGNSHSLPPAPSNDQWANTMPTSRPRGRGRLRPEEIEAERAAAAKKYNQPGGLDSYSASSSVENLAHPSSRSDREWSHKHQPSSSTPSLAHGQSSNHTFANQALPLPGPLRRRPSSGSLQGDRSGRRTPTGRHTPTDSGRTTPINLPPDQDSGKVASPASQPKIMDIADIVVPEIEDWSAEVERSEQLQGSTSRPPSVSRVDILSSPCQDWNEEVERAEQLQESVCSFPSKTRPDNSSNPCQDRRENDWCEEVERSERLEASAARENHVRSPSPVSRPTDNVQWKKPQPTADWKKPRRSASGERHGPPSRPHEGGHDRPNSRGPSRDHSVERGGGGGPRPGGRGAGPGGPAGPWRRDHSTDRSQGNSETSWRNDRDQPAWRRDHSQDRGEVREGRVWRPAPGLSHGPGPSAAGRDHSGDRRARQNSGRDQDRGPDHGRRDHSPHERRNGPSGPEPAAGGRNRRASGRDHSGERGERGGRNRRNSGRDHSGERGGAHRRHGGRDHSHERGGPTQGPAQGTGRHRKNSGRDHSHERHDRDRGRHRRNSGRDHSRDRRDHSRDGLVGGMAGGSRRERMGLEWRHRDREGIDDDWRRPPANAAKQSPPPQKAPGILVLPQEAATPSAPPLPSLGPQRHLYDPSNPNKPIIVVNPSVRASSGTPSSNGLSEGWSQNLPSSAPSYQHFESSSVFAPPHFHPSASLVANQFGTTRPVWYDPYSENFRMSSQPHLILDIEKADWELHCTINSGKWLENWTRIEYIRKFIQSGFDTFVLHDIRFLHKENADQHLWKILFYNFIEILRKSIAEGGPEVDQQKKLLLQVIDQGTQFFESLLMKLQDKYMFRLDDYLSGSETTAKLTAQTAVAILVAQKIYLFLGDLARYREQANETSNYGKARQWYIKAHQVNPKSGRPYNQLAILAVYARRKIDAVYYYMRGLMSSSMVVHTARENLLSLFDDNSKKYEQTEKKRREDREAKDRSRMMEKEGKAGPPSLRREFWYHPNNGQRVSRTTSNTLRADHSDTEEELAKLKNVDLNKRFVMSFLHIHGKLFTKVGMETFQIAAVQMLKEFYALLQHSPIPLTANRFLQLLALNMFAIENTKLKDVEAGYRSAAQEAALVVSLQMFSVLLERCVTLLRDQVSRGKRPDLLVEPDVVALLPAVKIWCDWLTCHQDVWNPPPGAADYHVGPPGDTWTRLAALVNLLDTLDVERAKLAPKPLEGYSKVHLPEDATLAGFMPLMAMTPSPQYAARDMDPELVQVCARIKRLQFFGHIILCGIDPPVLRLHKDELGRSEYISVAARTPRAARHSHHDENAASEDGAASPADSLTDDDLLDVDLEEEEEGVEGAPEEAVPDKELTPSADASADEVRALLLRREQLEKHRRQQERHRKRVQDIIRQSAVEVEIEVRPHFIVPDTNCFVDHLEKLKQLAAGQTFQLMVPVVVVGELEGLQRGGVRPGGVVDEASTAHADRVARSAKDALAFLRQRPGPPSLRCVTTKGSTLASTVFTQENDGQQDMMNDDKILATCLNLSRTSSKDEMKPGEPRRLVRDVVLLTDDRNLRVKALSRDVPVRELPDFMRWANLG